MKPTLLQINEPHAKPTTASQRLQSNGELTADMPAARLALSQFAALPIWDLAFRPWFLAAAISSMVSLSLWMLFLHGKFSALATLGITPLVWHIHEMLFGFGATIAMGFLLTAAQTWTGKRGINGSGLIVLTGIWLLVRVLLLTDSPALQLAAIALQGLWWLVGIAYLANMVYRARSKRNYQFIPLLLVMMSLNLGVLIADYLGNSQLALHLARSAILLFCVLVTIITGRVIPFFTGRGANNAHIGATPRIDTALPLVGLLAVAVFFSRYFVNLPFSPAALLILAGGLHLYRLCHWSPLSTLKVPLLWSLQASYLALAVGLIALGMSFYTSAIRFGDALHLITIGTFGGMILAMMARVSLGHTGRALKPHATLSLAFALVLLGAIGRFFLTALQQPIWGWDIGAACWIIAFAIFVWHYTKILTGSRADS